MDDPLTRLHPVRILSCPLIPSPCHQSRVFLLLTLSLLHGLRGLDKNSSRIFQRSNINPKIALCKVSWPGSRSAVGFQQPLSHLAHTRGRLLKFRTFIFHEDDCLRSVLLLNFPTYMLTAFLKSLLAQMNDHNRPFIPVAGFKLKFACSFTYLLQQQQLPARNCRQ
jgi:hypothetical protein